MIIVPRCEVIPNPGAMRFSAGDEGVPTADLSRVSRTDCRTWLRNRRRPSHGRPDCLGPALIVRPRSPWDIRAVGSSVTPQKV